MKTKKILGIVVLTLVITLALGVAAYAATEVSDEAGLRAALAVENLSTDAEAPTEIVLTNDINVTGGTITVDAPSKVYVTISGNYTIKNMQDLEGGNLLSLKKVEMTLNDTDLDGNYGNDNETLATDSDCSIIIVNLVEQAALTLNGNASVINGYNNDIMRIGAKSTLTINDEAKIANRKLDTNNKNLFSVGGSYGNPSAIIMNGGEITGCDLNNPIASLEGQGNALYVKLYGGSIHDNNFLTNFTLFTANTGDWEHIVLGGTEVETNGNTFFYWTNSGGLGITEALPEGIVLESQSTKGTNYYQSVLKGVEGYTLTMDDFKALGLKNLHSGREQALDPAKNEIASYYVSEYAIPVGAILIDGTIIETQAASVANIVANDKLSIGNVEVEGYPGIKYDNAWPAWAKFTPNEAIEGVGILFSVNGIVDGGQNGMVHGAKIKNTDIDAVADAYLEGPTIVEDGAEILLVAALKGIPRNLENKCYWARAYIKTADRYYYGNGMGDRWFSMAAVKDTGAIPQK